MRNKIVMIDNFDSFTYNLVDIFRLKGLEVSVYRNDVDLVQLESMIDFKQSAVILSPGPGCPKDAGICLDLIKKLKGRIPILGICLGHQSIVEAYGGEVGAAKEIVHGKGCSLEMKNHPLFDGVPDQTTVARYHSLVATKTPENLKTIATGAGYVMAVANDEDKVYGMQFHPKSILTTFGFRMVMNFLKCTN